MSNIQLTIKKHEGAWAVFRMFDDWGPIILAHSRTAPDAQEYAWQCATEYAKHEHDVTVTIDARG